MQVRIRTTPGGILGGMLAACVVGAVFVLAAVDHAGLMDPATTTPAPSPTVVAQASPVATHAPATAAPAVASLTPSAVKAPPGSGMRDGGNYILGIYIPPPGER